MSIRRFLLWSVAGVAMLVLAISAALYWASRSETFLRWGIEKVATSLPCSLRFEGLRGAFMEPVQVEYLICENADMRVEARSLALVWSPWLLIDRQLSVTSLQIETLAYTSRSESSDAVQLPEDLGLPITIAMASLQIGTLLVQTGEDTIEINSVDATYRGDSRSHHVALRDVASPWGRASGDARLGAAAPFALSAALTVQSSQFEGWPVSANIKLKGELLRQINADFNAVSNQVAVTGRLDVAPFDSLPVKSIGVSTSNIDAAMFDARLPQTALSIELDATPIDNTSLTGRVRAKNTAFGRLDQKRLPVHRLESRFVLNFGLDDPASMETALLKLSNLYLDLGKAGTASGTGELAMDHARLVLQVNDFDLRETRSDLRQTKLNGEIRLDHRDERQLVAVVLKEKDMQLEGRAEVTPQRVVIERMTARAGGARLQASATLQLDEQFGYSLDGTLLRFDPARFGDFPEADINATVQVSGRLRPEWRAEVRYRLSRSRLNGVALGGSGTFAITPSRLYAADALLDYGGNDVKLTGNFGERGDTLRFVIDAKYLEQLHKEATGQVQASGVLTGTLKRPAIEADLKGRMIAYSGLKIDEAQLQLSAGQDDDPLIRGQTRLRGVRRGETSVDSVTADIDGTLGKHTLHVTAKAPDLQLAGHFDGGWDQSRRIWSGTIVRLANEGEYAFEMKRPARFELAADHLLLGATQVTFSKTDIMLDETRYDSGKLAAKGSISGVRAARLFALMDKPPAIESTLVLGGRWEIQADKTMDGFVELSRTQGDIVIPGEEPVTLGLKEFRVIVRAEANQLSGEATLRSVQGDARVSAQTQLENRGTKWGVAGNAPLILAGKLQMQSIRPIATLASRAVTADGQLKLTISASGTIAEPRLSGSVEGDNLKFEHIANGIFLRDGVVRARFGDNALTLTEFRFKGGQGEVTARGRFLATGTAPVMELQWNARKLAIVQHPELRLTVSGAGQLGYRDKIASLKGELIADQGRVILRNRTFPALGDDVVVVGRENPSQIAEETKRMLLDLKLDLGSDFTVVGRGLDARMAGKVHLTSGPDKPLSADGEVRVVSGTYEAYGRRLQIDRGTIYFAGPVGNPSLNIRAMRKNQQVEAGVEITGTAKDPQVRLVSEPNVSDPNKLAWLVLGREAESGSAQDNRALQSSAVALAAGLGTTPLQQQLARAVGLDEITFIPGSGESQGGVVAVGKQVSDRIYLTQEFSSNAAGNTFRVSYQLTRRWSLRSESGQTNAVDLFFTLSFD